MNSTTKKERSSTKSFSLFLFLLQELGHVFRVFAPLVDQGLHVVRQLRIEADHLLCLRVDKAQSLGVEGLAREKLEAVLDELTVFRVYRSLADLRTVVALVVEERVADPVEMDTDLMGTAGLQTTFDNCHISESFEDPVVGHRMLSMVTFRKYLEPHAVVRVASYVSGDGTFVFLQVSPYDGDIASSSASGP